MGLTENLSSTELIEKKSVPEPVRKEDGFGGTDHGPRNVALDRLNPDMLVPPVTDRGTIPNLKFSFGMDHMRLQSGGWTRQVTVRELPVSKSMAGVNMRLNSGGIRELHWHKEAEWAIMLDGVARISAVDQEATELRRRCRCRRPVEFPLGHPAFNSGAG